MPTIGQILGETRREKGISVEDVAHETRIHPNVILSIEEDDLSQFPSVAYARSFIRKYSDHLGVDLSSAIEALNSSTALRLSENELMGEMKKAVNKDRRFRLERHPKGHRRRLEKPGGAPLFLNFILLLLIVALGLFYFLGYKAGNIEEAKAEFTKSIGKVNPLGGTAVPDDGGAAPAAPVAATSPGLSPPVGKPQDSAPVTAAANPGPRPAPEYPVIKPAVTVQFEDTLTETPPPTASPGGVPEHPLRPRKTPRMVLAEEPVKPPSSEDLPAVNKPAVEPQAILRPEGTDPAATREGGATANPASRTTESQNPGGNAPAPKTPLRAVPVAASE